MAQNKKSVLLYCDIIHTVEQLDNEDAGLLFKHYLRYINDQNPEPPSKLIQIVFEPIKQNLKRDLKKWEEKSVTKSDSGVLGNLKRWHIDLYNKVVNKELTLEESQNIAKHRKTSHEVANIAVTDTVKDTVTVKVKDKYIFNAKAFMCDLGYDEKLVSEWFEVRKLKKLKNTETALKGFHKEVMNSKTNINEVLKTCVEKSWGGFKAEWLNNQSNEQKKEVSPILMK